MIHIQLTRGMAAMVDDEDADLAMHSWAATPGNKGIYYATSCIDGRTTYMHRMILQRMNPALRDKSYRTDHRDRNGLNNVRHNLRAATPQQNAANSRKYDGTSSALKGVTFDRWTGRWKAQITVNQRNLHLGRFDTEEEAAEAYGIAAVAHFGEFARQ